MSLARNHQAVYITYNVGRTAANSPISFMFLSILDAPRKLFPIPPSTRNTDASGARARGVPTGRKCFLDGVRASSDTPSTRNYYKVSPITEGIKSGPGTVSFTTNRSSFTLRAKDSQRLFKVTGLAEGSSNSANMDRWPSRRSNCYCQKKKKKKNPGILRWPAAG